MKRILIGKDIAYAAKIGGGTIADSSETNLLADGALAIFTEAGVLVPIAALSTILNDVKNVYFAIGSGVATTGSRITKLIPREPTTAQKKAYIAPVAQVSFIGEDSGATGDLNLPSLAIGDVLGIRLINGSDGTFPAKRTERFEYEVKAGDTSTSVITSIISKMTDSLTGSQIATAAVIGSQVGISLTGKTGVKMFEVNTYGILSDATIEAGGAGASTIPVIGHGTYAQIADLEETNDIELGDTNQIRQPSKWFKRAKTAVSSATYTTWTMIYEQMHDTPTSRKIAGVWELVLALPSGAGTFSIANLDTAMAAIFGLGVTTANQTTETGT